MLTDPKLRAQVDSLWDKFWTGGLTNPLDAIEQVSYLLFLKRLDDRENDAILMNPPSPKGMPFKGAVDKGGVHPTLPSVTLEGWRSWSRRCWRRLVS